MDFFDSVYSNSRAPFTIQRIAELITAPQKHYKRTDKFLRGIEKVVIYCTMQDYCVINLLGIAFGEDSSIAS